MSKSDKSFRVVRIGHSGEVIMKRHEVVLYPQAQAAEKALIQALLVEAGLEKRHPKLPEAARGIKRASRAVNGRYGLTFKACKPAQIEWLEKGAPMDRQRQGVLWLVIQRTSGRRSAYRNLIVSFGEFFPASICTP